MQVEKLRPTALPSQITVERQSLAQFALFLHDSVNSIDTCVEDDAHTYSHAVPSRAIVYSSYWPDACEIFSEVLLLNETTLIAELLLNVGNTY